MSVRKVFSYFNNAITGSGVFLLLLGVEFFCWLRNPLDSVPAWCFYVFQLIMIVLGCIIYACLRHHYETKCLVAAIPVRYVCGARDGDGWIMIASSTPMLEINRIVSICAHSIDSDLEETIAIGYVETKNDLGNFQIKVPKTHCRTGYDLQILGYKLLTIKPTVENDWLS